jgi:hypothetical protein
MVSGREYTMILILENGSILKLMVTVFIPGQTEIGTKVSGTCASKTAKVLILLQMVKPILVSLKMVKLTVKENTSGPMELTMLVNSSEGKRKEKESGKVSKEIKTVTLTKEISSMIKNMVKVFLLGQVEIFTRETTTKMKDMEMDKCSGQMAASMRENGEQESNME